MGLLDDILGSHPRWRTWRRGVWVRTVAVTSRGRWIRAADPAWEGIILGLPEHFDVEDRRRPADEFDAT